MVDVGYKKDNTLIYSERPHCSIYVTCTLTANQTCCGIAFLAEIFRVIALLTVRVVIPADDDVRDGRPLHRAVPAEGEARLAVDVLRVPCVRAVVALVDGDLHLRSFGMGLPEIREKSEYKHPTDRSIWKTAVSSSNII